MKKIVSLFLCFVLVFSLCACGDTQPVPETTTSEKTDTSVEAKENKETSTEVVSGDVYSEDTSVTVETTEPDDEILAEILALENQYAGVGNDELTWDYNTSTKTIIISGKGPMKDYTAEEPAWNTYCDEAVSVVIGDEVTSVSNIAFWGFSALTDLKLGAAVEYVGDYAFQYCTELRTVNFPESLKYVGNYAFTNTLLHSDNGFILPDGLLHVGDNSFFSAFKESFVSIPASLVSVGKDAFANIYIEEFRIDENNPVFTADNKVMYSKDMTTLMYYPAMKNDKVFEVPESVTSIISNAIQVNNYLTKIVIPAGVSNIEEGAIYWNYALESIEVDENNPDYMSVEDVLFTKDGKNLLCYPCANVRKEYSVPSGCERICNLAMSSATNLIVVHYNDSLQEIGYEGFAFCDNLSEIGLSQKLTTIGTEAFLYCDSLTDVFFDGTPDEWANVYIQEGNEIITNGGASVRFEN